MPKFPHKFSIRTTHAPTSTKVRQHVSDIEKEEVNIADTKAAADMQTH
jgi:NAD kinase